MGPAGREQAAYAFEETAVHESRNVLRDCMMKTGEVDLELPHVPLLFIGASEDKIIPERKLVEKNSKAYKDEASITGYREFTGRSHYICGEPGWEEVAQYIARWLEQHVGSETAESISSQRRP